MRARVEHLENLARLREEEIRECQAEITVFGRRIEQLQCGANTGHTPVFKKVLPLPGAGVIYIFECAECSQRVYRGARELTDEQRCGLRALGYDVPEVTNKQEDR